MEHVSDDMGGLYYFSGLFVFFMVLIGDEEDHDGSYENESKGDFDVIEGGVYKIGKSEEDDDEFEDV
jgi:hypothetical protein